MLAGDGSEELACWLRPARLMCLPQNLIHNSNDLLLTSALQVLSSKAGFNTISHGFVIKCLTCIDLPSHQQYKCSPNIQQSKHPYTKHVPWQSCTSCQSPSCPSETTQCLLLTTLISPRVVSQPCECKKKYSWGNSRTMNVATLLLETMSSILMAQSLSQPGWHQLWIQDAFGEESST